MIKLFFNPLRRSGAANRKIQNPTWNCDPLAHPVLDRMSLSELGDLPMGSARCGQDCGC